MEKFKNIKKLNFINMKKGIIYLCMILFVLSYVNGAWEDDIVMLYDFNGTLQDSVGGKNLQYYSNTPVSTYVTDHLNRSNEAIEWYSNSFYIADKYGWGNKTNFSVAFWYKSNSSTNHITYIERNPTTWSFYLFTGGSNPSLATQHDGGSVSTSSAINDGNWHLVVFTRSSTKLKSYVNGNFELESTASGTLNDFVGGEQRWNWNTATSTTTDRNYGKFVFWNKELTLSEILQFYEDETTSSSGTEIVVNTTINLVKSNNLILSTSPLNNSIVTNSVNFEIFLNDSATCELYINNDRKYVSNGVSYSTYITLEPNKEYSYFNYCYKNENQTRYYELQNPIYFNTSPIPTNAMSFTIKGIDFDETEKNFYLTSPCISDSVLVANANVGGNTRFNNEVKIKKFENSVATMEFEEGNHSVCIFHGIIQINTENLTSNYFVNQVNKNIELGKFFFEVGSPQNYLISLEEFDIYSKVQPEAWGTSWKLIIANFLLFIVSIIILFASIITNSSKGVVIGGILLASSLGFSVANFVGFLF